MMGSNHDDLQGAESFLSCWASKEIPDPLLKSDIYYLLRKGGQLGP
jgi:hypothetical protein